MFAKPLDERISRWIFEQVYYPVRTYVHQNRAVSASPTKRKLIDSEQLALTEHLERMLDKKPA